MYIISLQLIVCAYYHNVDALFNSSRPLKTPSITYLTISW